MSNQRLMPFQLLASLVLIGILAIQSGICAESQTKARIHGSDLFEAWLPGYFASNTTDIEFDFNLSGSEVGMAALEKHYADACLYIAPGHAPLTLTEPFKSELIGYYVLYVHANQYFPSNSISKEVIFRVGQASNLTPIDHWVEVYQDANYGWEAKQAEILIDHSHNDFTLGFFRQAFLKSEKPSTRVHICQSQASLIDYMKLNFGCIVISPRSNTNLIGTKILQLSDFDDTTSYPPALETVQYGDYHAAFPIYLILDSSNPQLELIKDAFRSAAFHKALTQHHILPGTEIYY